jgi:hypothetical protein
MPRNRIIYQSEALYVSKNKLSTSESDHKQLKRIQNIDYSFSVPREYINQYGQLSAIDSIVYESPTVSLNFFYYLSDLENESDIGFYVKKRTSVYTGSNELETNKSNGNFSGYTFNNDSNFISNNIIQESGFNFFIITSSEGSDLNLENGLSGKVVVGIGDVLIKTYSVEAKVGAFPTASIEAEGLNINSSIYKNYPINQFNEEVGFPIPSVNIQDGKPLHLNNNGYYNLIKLPNPSPNTGEGEISALRPSDITLSFNDFSQSTITDLTLNEKEINLQSFTLSVDLNRQNNQELGFKFVNSRPVGYPIVATLNINAIVNQSQMYNLIQNIDNSQGKSILISIKNPKNRNENALSFDLRNFLLTNESFTSNVGSNKNVNLTFESHFGSALNLKNGIFASGLIDASSDFSNKIYFNYELNSNWFNTNSWYTDNSFTNNAGIIPQSYSEVIMYGNGAAVINLDNVNWITPAYIDTRNVNDINGVCFYSENNNKFNGTILGNSSYWGNASPI